MEKCFNIAGPCFPDEHYMLPALERRPGIMRIVEQRSYFVLHAARQSGKTTALMAYWDRCKVMIPQGVVEIGAHAFEGCVNLSRVEIPEGVTKLDWSIFEGCTSLKEVVLPESCVELHGLCKVFKGCTSLERVVFKGKIDGLGGSFFAGCSALKEVVFVGSPPSVLWLREET